MLPPEHRVHDRDVLDALEAMGTQTFDGNVWRVTRKGRDPIRASAAGGRWNRSGEFEVLYTSELKEGALAEIGFRLALEPVWPSQIAHEVHELRVHADRSLLIPSLNELSDLGVDAARYASFDYSVTQAIAAAARFLGVDALLVPSARHRSHNVVVIADNLRHDNVPEVVASKDVDWEKWREGR